MEIGDIIKILEGNKDKQFVDRIINKENYPVRPNADGSVSTHLMNYGEADGKYVVFPSILFNEGKLTEHKPRDAFDRAMKSGGFIQFDDEKSASDFSQEYKKVWDDPLSSLGVKK